MERGPVLSASIESAYPSRNITEKGVAIRLDEKSQTYVLFDEDLCRYSIAWTGGFIDWKGVVYNGEHRVWPSVVGTPIFGLSLAPGWAKGGSFDDPRARYKSTEYTKESDEWRNRPYGPLPRDHARFKGRYQCGDRVVLSYTVGGVAVLDSPGFERVASLPVVTRTLNVSKSAVDLDLNVFEQPAGASDQVAMVVKAPAGVTSKGGRLHIPAAATPAKVKLLIARGAAEALNALGDDGRKSAEPIDLATLTQGGPARYPEAAMSTGVVSTETDKPYVVDTIREPWPNPSKVHLRFGAFDFYPDGKSAAITTWDGDVWKVSGIDEKLDHLTWQRIATGLFQPLGLRIVKGDVYVLCRDQICRLHDLNGDGETDFYECFNGDAQVTEHFHEFAMGLQTDAAGNFYYAKSARHALDAVVPQHGTLLKVSADGSKTEILANGFRAANGVGVGPDGLFAATDQEGFYTPANRINLLTKPGGFYGNLWSYLPTPRTMNDGLDPPLCWLPTTVDRSPAEDAWVTSDKWGPLKGSMVHTSYGTGKLFLVPYEIVDGVPQGGAVQFPDIAFRTGVMRARFNPVDGQLYVCGLVGWATNMSEPGGFHRVRYTGAPVRMPVGLHVTKDAVAITFTCPLEKASATEAANYAVQQWNYRWTSNYGSKHYSVAKPEKQGADDVEVTGATLSDDGKTVTLKIPGLRPVMQMKLQLDVKSADGASIKQVINNTVNRVP
jgi:hypothetical protein